jgi:hypothetical protein
VFDQQYIVPVEGQTDILTMGIPFICPYNPEGVMNPILVMCMGLGYMFNMYRGKPLVREGGVLIMTHPTYRTSTRCTTRATSTSSTRCSPTPPTRRSCREVGAQAYAEDEWYRHLYRTGNAYHGVHPFYAWYWGAHGQQHAGKVDHRRRRPGQRAPPRLHPGVDDGRRVRDRDRRRRPLPHHHPPPRPERARRRGELTDGRADPLPAAPASAPSGGPSRSCARRRPVAVVRVPVPGTQRAEGRRGPEGSAVKLGADYDTEWARSPLARAARGVITEGPLRLLVQGLAAPDVVGLDRLSDLTKLDDPRRSSSPPTTTATSTPV